MRLLLLLQVLLFLFTVVARAPTAAHAWRKEGHYMVCKIAEVTEAGLPTVAPR
jgi:hypothetical protein